MSQNTSHLVPIIDPETGEQAKDKTGALLFEERFGMHPDSPRPAPTDHGRGPMRPGEEKELEDERVAAERMQALRAQEAELQNREKSLSTQAEAMKAREKAMLALMKGAGMNEKQIAEAMKKAGVEPSA
jgi:hypothetical protein